MHASDLARAFRSLPRRIFGSRVVLLSLGAAAVVFLGGCANSPDAGPPDYYPYYGPYYGYYGPYGGDLLFGGVRHRGHYGNHHFLGNSFGGRAASSGGGLSGGGFHGGGIGGHGAVGGHGR